MLIRKTKIRQTLLVINGHKFGIRDPANVPQRV